MKGRGFHLSSSIHGVSKGGRAPLWRGGLGGEEPPKPQAQSGFRLSMKALIPSSVSRSSMFCTMAAPVSA